ncbi:autoinducer binding domain-containing protein [Pseudomonas vanderleydeniana]|uniref:Autoinducer binding domain-containing protein n=1 Tax=Pseudomonas vanderleydeniana TaxID=2745495 RepID=A0A9E6PI19_9PSED|nr:autoinducer binding domain-containing protein [Pseudomonas vanderleydeniana]QXI26844.1 autoinducer binding domain-containing protein [Pseudomonas vanderleydeniana]
MPMRQNSDFMTWWVDVNLRFASCGSADELFRQIENEIYGLGFDCFAYGYRRPVPFNQGEAHLVGTYPEEWLKRYNEKGYGATDLSVIKARSQGLVVWQDHGELLDSRLFCEAREWNLNIGATFVARGRNQTLHMLGISRSDEPIGADEVLLLKLKLRCITELLEDNLQCPGSVAQAEILLSTREAEILRWIADGKCSRSISEILSLSEHTVNYHVKSIQRKFGSSNRVLTAAYAAALGVI